ncbi:MAG: UDP-N-acetylmuramoyl-L-alanyl-D-glutamate--2,6-diaminopimelate ligase [Anaerolineales bacterium]|nr:UDP-N-acetylmuramoyl-L-alanyl-D-glutamate--2,6-diaminopimelate ligase [Anaerolineales bacterium]
MVTCQEPDNLGRFIRSLAGPVLSVTADSRTVEPGSVFVAVAGGSFDGHDFIQQAVENGAIGIVCERPGLSAPEPVLVVPDGRLALAYLSAYLYGYPSQQMVMVGVTGTDGKTTTVNLIHRILVASGIRAGMISTVNAVLGDKVEETGLHVTTPDAPDVQRMLSEMVRAGLSHCTLETTSHGLAQHRVSACDFDVAAITNITHEHLDYHGGYRAYRQAKTMLFEGLLTGVRKPGRSKTSVLNADDPSFEYLSTIEADRQISYALDIEPEFAAIRTNLHAENIRFDPLYTTFDLVVGGRPYPIRSNLVGRYNISNVLCAAGVALALDIPVEGIQRGVGEMEGIPGRMERIRSELPFQMVVDFAHTPNALERTLETGREIVDSSGRVIAVFGSAGLRDVAKRRMMAEISARKADITILTAEDPRTEPLDSILADMADECAANGAVEGLSLFRVRDRMKAIYQALILARPGDLVLVCGKGHEQSMCFGAIEYPWDDRQAVKKAAAAFQKGEPAPDSGLPTGYYLTHEQDEKTG